MTHSPNADPASQRPSTTRAWHALPPDEVLRELDSGRGGLSAAEARRRLESAGPNVLQAARGVSPWVLLAGQFKNVLIVIPWRRSRSR